MATATPRMPHHVAFGYYKVLKFSGHESEILARILTHCRDAGKWYPVPLTLIWAEMEHDAQKWAEHHHSVAFYPRIRFWFRVRTVCTLGLNRLFECRPIRPPEMPKLPATLVATYKTDFAKDCMCHALEHLVRKKHVRCHVLPKDVGIEPTEQLIESLFLLGE